MVRHARWRGVHRHRRESPLASAVGSDFARHLPLRGHGLRAVHLAGAGADEHGDVILVGHALQRYGCRDHGHAAQFYKDFGTYSVSATECVRNFSNSCSGKTEELRDIQDNRNRTDFRIVGSTLLGSPAVSIGSQRVTAEYRQRCQFEDVEIRTGRHYRVEGGCFLTAVYENWRWWLCESHFQEPIVVTGPLLSGLPLSGFSKSLRQRLLPMAPGSHRLR